MTETVPNRSTATTKMLSHNRIDLALHLLRDAPGRALLLLHGLGEQSPSATPDFAVRWPGPIYALDFSGHGASTVPRGGGYTAEILLADADAALAEVGEATVVGRGLGAYIALQLAGARAEFVHGAVLCDGPGLAGGSTEPTSGAVFSLPATDTSPDPYALVELGSDLRPPDYATAFVRLSVEASDLDEPITVAAIFRPSWLEAVAAELGVATTSSITDALEAYA